MARSSDKNSHRFETEKNGKQFVMGITMIESPVKFAKVAWT